MKTIFRIFGIRWWVTIREYQTPQRAWAQINGGTTCVRHQRCSLTGLTRRQTNSGRGWKTDRSFRE